MKPKRLTDRQSRMRARLERDMQWEFMKRVARQGVVWICPWDKYRRHGPRCANVGCRSRIFGAVGKHWQCFGCNTVMRKIPDDGVYVCGLMGANEFLTWIQSHTDWWKRGPWSAKRCARSIRITAAGRKALRQRHLYDMEPIYGGMVQPGYVVTPWPKTEKKKG